MKESKWSATHIRALSLVLLIGALNNDSSAAPGDLDLSFDPGSGVNGPVNAIALQPDGKVIIGGQFTTVRGLVRANLARLNADGSGDPTFSIGFALPNAVYALALQPDGKVLVGHADGPYGLTRFNADGSYDTNFNNNANAAIASTDPFYPIRVSALLVQPDGKVLYAGENLLRLHPDGTLDTNFNSAAIGYVYSMARQPDGKLIVGGYFYTDYVGGTPIGYGLARLNTDGSLDNTFDRAAGQNGLFLSIVLQADGKVLIGGKFIGTNNTCVARLNSNGTLDPTFAEVTGTGDASPQVNAIGLQSDGKVLIGGYFRTVEGYARTNWTRLNANGTVDLSFTNTVGEFRDTSVRAISMQTNGTVFLGGAFTMLNGTNRHRVARVNSDGSLDSSFHPGRGVDDPLSALVGQPDGKVVAASAKPATGGYFATGGAIGRLNANGTADSSFNPGSGPNAGVATVALQPDAKILIGGSFTAFNGTNRLALARLNTDGGLDVAFNPNVIALVPYDPIPSGYAGAYSTAVTTVLLQADGGILVAGYNVTLIYDDNFYDVAMRFFVVRFLTNGDADPAFTSFMGQPTNGEYYWDYGWYSYPVSALAVQPDGKIILSGQFNSVNDTNHTGVVRLNANGTRDNSFTPAIGMHASVSSLGFQPDGKLLMAGSFGFTNSTTRTGIWRLQANGVLDSSFNPVIGSNATVSAFSLQPDGKVLIGGSFTNINGTNRTAIARLNGDGSLDNSFNPGTVPPGGSIRSLVLPPNGDILLGGSFTTVNGVMRPYVARLCGDFSAPSLNIARSNAFVIVSWPVSGLNFQLQENTDLSLPNSWSPVAQSAVTNAGQISVTVPTTVGRKFFRLKSQ